MLLQFTVGNFLSFREPVTFSMMASPEIDGIPEDLRPVGDGKNVLSIGAIYGANASGKSNLLYAIAFARHLIFSINAPDQSLGVMSHSLDRKSIEGDSFFQFIFKNGENICKYGFKCNDSMIIEEWLYVDGSMYFLRNFIDGIKKIELGDVFKENEEFYKFIVEGTRKEQLFIYELQNKNSDILRSTYQWFRNDLVVISDEGDNANSEPKFYAGKSLCLFIKMILKCADSGIQDINLKFTDNRIHLNTRHKSDLVKKLKESLSYTDMPIVADVSNLGLKKIYGLRDDDLCEMEFEFRHSEDMDIPFFYLHQESAGTQCLVDLLLSLMPSMSRIIIIDELDRRLHPNLSRLLIEVWRKMNRQESQLIFTTHDDNLLSDDLLRRDEVWLVDKDETGHSSLTSLAEFKIPEGTNIERQYLRGRFGGVPYLRREELDAFLEEIQNEGANLK
ncbi:ATP/GTP-binding protein [Armatimonas sp.]|uniref:AAA family ATPase n=1 Tax=Armatimonas sp. TaxID=1872638 RepID=UPI003752B450